MSSYLIREFAERIGVSVQTLRRWESEGRLKPASRTPGNRRLYSEEQLRAVLSEREKPRAPRKSVGYARVSSQAQRPDLKNQQAAMEQFCIAQGIAIDEWIAEIGGGMNFGRPRFLELVDRIVAGEISVLVVAHKDRLARFGFDLVAHLCEKQGTRLVVLNAESLSPEQEMVQDLMAITHTFSARLYGLRRYRKSLKSAMTEDLAGTAPGDDTAEVA
jgi:putative resolvase